MIVRNSKINGRYGIEEQSGGCPIIPGRLFQMTIGAGESEIVINIDGTFFASYKYRLGLNTAKFINSLYGGEIKNIVLVNNEGIHLLKNSVGFSSVPNTLEPYSTPL